MVDTVKARPSHYEVLGLEPDASDEEIARAFAREMSPLRPRPVGGLAQLSLAYETLRDPARRRAYDQSLAPRPEPAPEPASWSMPRQDGWPFIASARIGTADLPAIESLPSPRRSPAPEAEPRQDPVAGRRSDPFVAAPPIPHAEPQRRPQAEAKPAPIPQADENRAYRLPPQQSLVDAEDGTVEWKRPVMIGGALLLSVAFLGAWLGVESANDIDEAQPQKAMTLASPKAKAAVPSAEAPPLETSSSAEFRPERQAPAGAEARPAPLPRPAPAEQQQQEEAAQSEQSRIEEIASSLALEETEEETTAAATAAKLPLPDSVVARTIRRIGYSCGEVASTAPVEGGATGVFKVTCTSGQSYRAAPIGGRYHFRRWGR